MVIYREPVTCHIPFRNSVFMTPFGPNHECGEDEKVPASVGMYVRVLLRNHICRYLKLTGSSPISASY